MENFARAAELPGPQWSVLWKIELDQKSPAADIGGGRDFTDRSFDIRSGPLDVDPEGVTKFHLARQPEYLEEHQMTQRNTVSSTMRRHIQQNATA